MAPRPAGAVLVWTLTAQTNPAWLDLPGAQDSRRHSPGGHKVTQASPPRQGTPLRGGISYEELDISFEKLKRFICIL